MYSIKQWKHVHDLHVHTCESSLIATVNDPVDKHLAILTVTIHFKWKQPRAAWLQDSPCDRTHLMEKPSTVLSAGKDVSLPPSVLLSALYGCWSSKRNNQPNTCILNIKQSLALKSLWFSRSQRTAVVVRLDSRVAMDSIADPVSWHKNMSIYTSQTTPAAQSTSPLSVHTLSMLQILTLEVFVKYV